MNRSQTVGIFSGPRKEMETAWRLTRTLRDGTDGMRREKDRYTPPTARERKDPTMYAERIASSVLYNVYDETIARIASLPFEKPPTIVGEIPKDLEEINDDADRCGNSLSVFMSTIYQDAIDKGMGMFLVDHVSTVKLDGQTMRADEADAAGIRPYFSRIEPDNFIGARWETEAGREVVKELRIREWAYKPSADGIGDELVERVRVWTTETVELWERNYGMTVVANDRMSMSGQGDTSGFSLIEEPRPHMFPGGKIPLVVVYTKRIGFMQSRPPLLGLAHLNVKHWNQQSVHDAALRFCMSPVLFGRGLTREEAEQKPSTGEGATLLSVSQTAELSFVEIAGSSLEQSTKQIDKTEQRMRAASVEPLQAGAATATGEMRAELKDQSEAQKWVEAMEWAIFRAYQIAAEWVGEALPEDFNVTLHRASSLLQAANPARTTALQSDRRDGNITLRTYLEERKRSGDFADDFDPEAEAAAVEGEAAAAVERQMQAMASKIIADRGDGGSVDRGAVGSPASAASPGDGGQPRDGGQPGDGADATLNEITLGIERLARIKDTKLLEAMRRQLAEKLGVGNPGKFTPPKAPAAGGAA